MAQGQRGDEGAEGAELICIREQGRVTDLRHVQQNCKALASPTDATVRTWTVAERLGCHQGSRLAECYAQGG